MELINKETVDAIQAALAPVAEKIGQGAAYVWTTVVTQQYVIGISYLIWAGATAIGGTAAFFLCRKFWRMHKPQKSYMDDADRFDVAAVICGALAVALPVVSIICLSQGVMHLINPGYYALEFFIRLGAAATQ